MHSDVDPAPYLVLLVKRRCHVAYLATPSVTTCQDLNVALSLEMKNKNVRRFADVCLI